MYKYQKYIIAGFYCILISAIAIFGPKALSGYQDVRVLNNIYKSPDRLTGEIYTYDPTILEKLWLCADGHELSESITLKQNDQDNDRMKNLVDKELKKLQDVNLIPEVEELLNNNIRFQYQMYVDWENPNINVTTAGISRESWSNPKQSGFFFMIDADQKTGKILKLYLEAPNIDWKIVDIDAYVNALVDYWEIEDKSEVRNITEYYIYSRGGKAELDEVNERARTYYYQIKNEDGQMLYLSIAYDRGYGMINFQVSTMYEDLLTDIENNTRTSVQID